MITNLTITYLWPGHSNFLMSLPVRLFRVTLEQTKAMISFQARSQLLRLCSVQTSYAQMQETLKISPVSQHVCQMKWPLTRSITCPCTSSTTLVSSIFPRANAHSLQASCLSPSFSTMADSDKRPGEVHEGVDAILEYWLGSWAASGFQVRSRYQWAIMTFRDTPLPPAHLSDPLFPGEV